MDLIPWSGPVDRKDAYFEIAELAFEHAQRAVLASYDRDASALTALAHTLRIMGESNSSMQAVEALRRMSGKYPPL
jgi:hypothetical protein